MRPALKLNAIEQEHLQEVFDAAGAARDDLPYTPAYDKMCQEFQDRTFKNAEKDQVFGALLKYVKTGGAPGGKGAATTLNEDQLKQLKAALSRHGPLKKLLPNSDEFESARKEFNKATSLGISEHEMWRSVVKLAGPRRAPPPRKKVVAVEEDDD